MAQQEPIRVVVEKRGGCLSGCGTAFAVLFLIAVAVKYWYISVGLIVVAVVIGAIQNSQKPKPQPARNVGPRDPWLNEVAVALADLGLTELTRNTGQHLGGTPLEGDIGLQDDRLLVYVNMFESPELARQAEIGLRAQPNIRRALANGETALRTSGPILFVANGRGGVVDDFRLREVTQLVDRVPLPPALNIGGSWQVRQSEPLRGSGPTVSPQTTEPHPDALEQLRALHDLVTAGVLTEDEFQAKKAELLRRV